MYLAVPSAATEYNYKKIKCQLVQKQACIVNIDGRQTYIKTGDLLVVRVSGVVI